MANLTIKDIARMAGVSTTAVSFVLNNRPGVSDATREKVQRIIRETSFIPNVHTRRLNLGKSFTIHVVLKQYTYGLYNQFALETLSGVFKEGKSLGYSIIFTLVDEDMPCEQIIESVRSKDCDGIILNQIDDPVLLSQLQKERNLTYLFVAHDLSVVRFICDRIAVIHKGVLVELAETEKLFAHPLHPYTRALLSAIPLPDPAREKNKVLEVYDPSQHDYETDKPAWVEVEEGHMVWANQQETEKYRKILNA